MKRLMLTAAAGAALWLGWGEPGGDQPHHQAEWLEAGGIRLRVLRAGAGDTTLLMLHGFGESLLGWRLTLDPLAQHYRVVALDLPGFGLSDKPPGMATAEEIQGVLDDFLARWTEGPVVVVGHSMGGQLAAQLALAHPDRIVAAVLIDPSGAGISPFLSDTSNIAASSARWVTSAIGYVLPVHDPAWLSEPTAAAAKYIPAADSASAAAALAVVEQFDFSLLATRFAELRQPVLLIWGKNDPTIPYEIGERIAAMLPCRRFVSLTATLHRPQQTQPDTVISEMLAFLEHPQCEAK
jgi:pimeloyl-ACP methyl ester carboxylesterase